MCKRLIFFVLFVFMITFLVSCSPPTFFYPEKVDITSGDNITDVSIAIDPNGIKHIVGIKNYRVVYFKGSIGKPTYQFSLGFLEPVGDTSTWKQFKPEVAVLNNGFVYIVWYEHHGESNKKIACQVEIPIGFDPTEDFHCNRIDEPGIYTTGLVRVGAKGNTAYVVYDRLHSSGYVDSVWYKKIEDLTTTGLVVSYLDVMEEAFIYSLDLAIDNNQKLHLAYIDQEKYFASPRLFYRSNATTYMDGSMSQNWAIAFGDPALNGNVKPCIHLYSDGSSTFVNIVSVWDNGVNQMIYIDSCNIIGCTAKTSISPTLSNSNWGESSKVLEVKGLGTLNKYALSFIAHNDLSSVYQVWYWVSPFSGNPTQITDTIYAKSQLNMVDGLIPIVGFLESWDNHGLVASFSDRVSIYDNNNGLREVKTSVCPGAYTSVSSDMASYVDIMANSIPVAGVWNVCSTTFFSSNAFLIDLPLMTK